ncbi:Rrf2 family transcriptional regulator [Candidatus Microgenomates bacterium]|nr:Rrf2 family transcriptional regulator [Candidatus Microgenomates bacterium]
MKITSKGHYGVQVMTDLAAFWGRGPLPLSVIAKDKKISHDYLEQIMILLRRHGLVHAERGAHGGYLLSRNPKKITLKEIIQALEGDLAPVNCVAKKVRLVCPSEGFCRSKKAWERIQKSFLNALDSVSLKEVLE